RPCARIDERTTRFSWAINAASEQVLDAELHAPRVARGGDCAELRGDEVTVWDQKVHVVQRVEDLEPQLQPVHPGERDALEHGEVERREVRTIDRVASRVAEGPGGLQLKRRGVEEPGRGPLVDGIRIADRV